MIKSWLGPLAAALLAVSGFFAVQALFGNGPTSSVTVPVELATEPSKVITETPLVASDGLTTKLGALRGSWLVLFFGYMSCPDICPTELAYLAKEMKLLGPAAARVRGVFVSVDPARDDPTRLGKFVRSFDTRFLGMTGTPENLATLAKAFGAYYKIDGAQVAHSSAFFLVSPDGAYARPVAGPHAPGDLSGILAPLVGKMPSAGLRVDQAWTRPTPAGAKVTALYMNLQNDGDHPAVIATVEVEGASRAEIHETQMEKGVMLMHAVEGLEIAAHDMKTLAPGGIHVMVYDLPKELVEGDQLKLTLTLKDGRKVGATASTKRL